MENQFDLIVIGAGPGGYVCAIKAAKLGLKTAIVEKDRPGGTCLNRGCIPAKAMLHASGLYHEIMRGEEFGIKAEGVSVDFEKVLSYKEETTDRLVQGVEQLLKANGVTRLEGKGVLLSDRKVEVQKDGESSLYQGKAVVLAAGSRPVILPIPGMELPGVLTSDDLFRLRHIPDSLVIIGGGVISVEFATIYASFGSKVTILEAMPRIVPNMDKEISQNLKMILKKRGVDIHTSAAVQSVEQTEDLYTCRFEEKGRELSVSGQYVLCAVGRKPETEGLFGEGAAPEMERGRILVKDGFATNLPGVYAIGDMIPGAQLAHTASAQGIAVAEILAGKEPSVALSAVPGCVYTEPEIASVGMTEDEAAEQGRKVRTGKFIMSANGKSLIAREERGFIKIVADDATEEILGAQMMCGRATDMIGEFVSAVANHMTVSQMLKAIRPHPTYNEGIGEALEELKGGAVHVMPKKRR